MVCGECCGEHEGRETVGVAEMLSWGSDPVVIAKRSTKAQDRPVQGATAIEIGLFDCENCNESALGRQDRFLQSGEAFHGPRVQIFLASLGGFVRNARSALHSYFKFGLRRSFFTKSEEINGIPYTLSRLVEPCSVRTFLMRAFPKK